MAQPRKALAAGFSGSDGGDGGDGPPLSEIISTALKTANPHGRIAEIIYISALPRELRLRAHLLVFREQANWRVWTPAAVNDIEYRLSREHDMQAPYFQWSFKSFLDGTIDEALHILNQDDWFSDLLVNHDVGVSTKKDEARASSLACFAEWKSGLEIKSPVVSLADRRRPQGGTKPTPA